MTDSAGHSFQLSNHTQPWFQCCSDKRISEFQYEGEAMQWDALFAGKEVRGSHLIPYNRR
jgi:hypothetical protein